MEKCFHFQFKENCFVHSTDEEANPRVDGPITLHNGFSKMNGNVFNGNGHVNGNGIHSTDESEENYK